MFLSDETNRSAFPADMPWANGPETGLLENFDAAYDQTVTGDAMFALESAFQQRYEEALDQVYQKTGERIPNIRSYTDIARALEAGTPLPTMDTRNFSIREGVQFNTDAAQYAADMEKVAERLRALNAQDSSIPTLDMMWNEVKQAAATAEQRAGNIGDRAGASGTFGSFAGGVAGSFTYRDPVNILTLGIGGVGKTLAARLATEAGAQSVIEGINQFTGVAENRRLLGLDQSLERSLENILFAAVGGAGLRGVAEGLPMGIRALENRFLPDRVAAREILNAVNTQAFQTSGRSIMPDVIAAMDPNNPSVRAAQRALADDAAIARGNPYGDTAAGRAAHREALNQVAGEVGDDVLFGENSGETRNRPLLEPMTPETGLVARNPVYSFPEGEARYVETDDGQVFVRTVDYKTDLGQIDGQAIGRESGPIRLPRGHAEPGTGTGFGEAHIEARHGDELRNAGYRDAADFVGQVAQGYNAVYRGRSGGLLLVRKTDSSEVAVVNLRPDGDAGFYEVQTAAIYRNKFFDNKKKLWEKPRQASQGPETTVFHANGHSNTDIASRGGDFNDRPRLPGVPNYGGKTPEEAAAAQAAVVRDTAAKVDAMAAADLARAEASFAEDLVDIGGQKPVSLEATILLDETEGPITIRQMLDDMADDDALVEAMKVCSI